MTKSFTSKKSLVSAVSMGLLLISSVVGPKAAAYNNTPNYYRCEGRIGGEYNYGRLPSACNASSFGDDKLVQSQFASMIFTDTASRISERERYAQELHGVIREAATYYIKRIKPAATTTEVNAWVNAVMVTASHESYWSHYRRASDAKLKMMRGDFGHGHGLMQVDDRNHYPAITNGTAWNVIGNITYAMDLLYREWVKAPSKSCVKTENNWTARTRAAWAAYNGGPTKHCRWTNPTDLWAENDKNFYRHFTDHPYEKYVADKLKASSLNVPCLMEKRENCPGKGPQAPPELQQGVLYHSGSRYCVINNEKAFCVAEARDAICLNYITGYTGKTASEVDAASLARYSPTNVDRHQLCATYEPTLMGVGTNLEAPKALNLRSTPGGGLLTQVPAGQTLEIKDFELRNAPDNDRYYKVSYAGKDGYLFGGNADDHAEWAVTSVESAYGTLAKVGERIRIVNPVGINLRASPGGKLLLKIPVRTEMQVLAVQVLGAENGVYYKVSYGGSTGYIYSGLLMPANTTAEWTQVLR